MVSRRRGRYAGDERSGFLLKVIALFILLFFVAGAVVLAALDVEPPSRAVEKVIPNARF